MNWYKKAQLVHSTDEAAQILGIDIHDKSLTQDKLRAIYVQKSKETHTGSNPGSDETPFKRVNEAYKLIREYIDTRVEPATPQLDKAVSRVQKAQSEVEKMFNWQVEKYLKSGLSLEAAMKFLAWTRFPPEKLQPYLLRKGFKPEATKTPGM